MLRQSRFIYCLRVWIGVVSFMAFGNTIQCFVDHSFLTTRLYTGSPSMVNGLSARLFGVWTLLSAGLRLYCAFDIYNRTVYNLTLFSFVLAFGHFMSEVFVYQTAHLTIGVLAPLLVSSVSIVTMVIGYQHRYWYGDMEATDENAFLAKKLKAKRR